MNTASVPAQRPIRRLDERTISRIAAGEVVENPASVVKELIENALDAGSTSVKIEIEGGGKRSIRVVDDGRGIPVEELPLAIERHATSKIDDDADLESIATLGFRGEALAAIASVSHLTLLSVAADQKVGRRLRVDNGQLVGREPASGPQGTSVLVENLFNAVPARRRFLRADSPESAAVSQVVSRYCLAYPHHRIELVRNGRTVIRTTGDGDLRTAIGAVLDAEVAAALVEVVPLEGDIAVSGLVSPPHLHRASRVAMSLFVNGRPVIDKRLQHAITQAYHALIPAGRFPVAVLMLRLDPEQLDVNVHPAKTEVRFRDSNAVYRAVQRAVRAAVNDGAPVAPLREAGRGPGRGLWSPYPASARPGGGGSGHAAGTHSRSTDTGWDDERGGAGAAGRLSDGRGRQPSALLRDQQADGATTTGSPRRQLPPLRALGQVALGYVVAEGPDGLYLVDQHAAHERIMYEKLMQRTGPAAGQRLLEPYRISGNTLSVADLVEHEPMLTALGFEIIAQDNEVVVTAVPEVIAPEDITDVIEEVAAAFGEGESPVSRAIEERLVRMVCKRATVKAGQLLSSDEQRALLRDLEATKAPFSCPHGRPTMIVLDRAELDRQFGRH